jgi:hypothetical protein
LNTACLEATYLGCKTIVPKISCFPEIYPLQNLYDPFSIKDILRIVRSVEPAENTGFLYKYEAPVVMKKYREIMKI